MVNGHRCRTLFRENEFLFSMTRTSQPNRRQSMASRIPTGPPPTVGEGGREGRVGEGMDGGRGGEGEREGGREGGRGEGMGWREGEGEGGRETLDSTN